MDKLKVWKISIFIYSRKSIFFQHLNLGLFVQMDKFLSYSMHLYHLCCASFILKIPRPLEVCYTEIVFHLRTGGLSGERDPNLKGRLCTAIRK